MRWDEMRWDEMGWDEMRWDEMRWDEMRWDEMRWDGMRWNRDKFVCQWRVKQIIFSQSWKQRLLFVLFLSCEPGITKHLMTSPTGLLDPSPRGTMRVQGKQNLVLFPLGPVIKYSPPTNVARVGVPDSACGLSLLLVFVLACSERFFSGYSGFPSLQKTLNSN